LKKGGLANSSSRFLLLLSAEHQLVFTRELSFSWTGFSESRACSYILILLFLKIHEYLWLTSLPQGPRAGAPNVAEEEVLTRLRHLHIRRGTPELLCRYIHS